MTRWELRPPVSREQLLTTMQGFGVSAPVAQVLAARGLEPQALSPGLRLTPNPALMLAAAQIVLALETGQRLRIHGDYDADGVTATAILVLGLRELGADVHGFIPHRLKEGYGIHPERVAEHAAAADLLISVDCGVSNVQEVAALLAAGVRVIITDHHAPGPDFPATLVVHPHLTPGYDEALHNLTGAGVAYHLLWAVYRQLGRPDPLDYLPLAALGTVADVAPLVGENRALVTAGLPLFGRSVLPGVAALLQASRVAGPVSVSDLGFRLAPRINAAGRMGQAEVALELLTTPSPRRAEELVSYLDILNSERRTIQDQMYQHARTLVNPGDPALVLTHPDWHPGLMGIVAAKLLEEFWRPVYIVAGGKGSVRSTPGISAVGGLREAAGLLHRYGGHPAAAGFSMDPANFGALQASLHRYAQQFPTPRPAVSLDAALPAGLLGLPLAQRLEALAPYGQGHPAATWFLRGALSGARTVGKAGNTLQYTLAGVKAVQFGESGLPSGVQDVAATLEIDTYGGRQTPQLMTQALRPGAQLELAGEPVAAVTPLPRLELAEATARLKTGASAYASGKVAEYLAANVPGLTLQTDAGSLTGAVVLFALPPEETLKRWLRQAAASPTGQARLSVCWGPKTLAELEGSYGPGLGGSRPGLHLTPAAEADAYRRWLWATLYTVLSDEAWERAAHHLLGLDVLRPDVVAAD